MPNNTYVTSCDENNTFRFTGGAEFSGGCDGHFISVLLYSHLQFEICFLDRPCTFCYRNDV